MMRIGATRTLAGASRERTPVADRPLERILAIPHTLTIQARLAMLTAGANGEGAVEVKALTEAKDDALERDELAAARPEGCWCYGRGGASERAVIVPGDEVPMVLGTYCRCDEGIQRRLLDNEIRQRAKAYAEQLQVAGLWDGARIPERFNGCTIDTFPITLPSTAAAVQRVKTWPESSRWALVIGGEFGVGKTGLSIGVLRLVAERRQVGLFVKVPDLLSRIRATYGKDADASELEVLESLRKVPYLVLDDIGAEKQTDWATAMLFQIIDDRHDNERKTIVTTNLKVPGELAAHLGERTMHRFEEGAEFVHLSGPNLRKRDRKDV